MAVPSSFRKLAAWYPRLIAMISCVYFAQLYVTYKPSYLRLHDYAMGLERRPFQERDLMRWPLAWAGRFPALQHATAGHALVNSPELLAVQVIGCVSLLLAGWSAVKLYRLVHPAGRVPLLPWALMIVVAIFDLVLTVPFSFPYDLPAMAFLGWGTYLVFARRFRWLLPLFVVATFNRETTLFLILILLLTAAVRDGRCDWRQVRSQDWLQAAVLGAVWVGVQLLQRHRYAGNGSEAGPRIVGNLHALARPMLWPNILSASAFLLPWIFFNRHRLPDARLRAALLVLPVWVLLLLSVGQILELRIYADITVLVAVAAAVLLEKTVLGARDLREQDLGGKAAGLSTPRDDGTVSLRSR